MDKAGATRVFQALGPVRVERGMKAFVHQDMTQSIWQRCFLGRALGITVQQRRKPGGVDACLAAAGIADCWGSVARAFDCSQVRPELEALAAEWLEQNRVAPAAPALAAVG